MSCYKNTLSVSYSRQLFQTLPKAPTAGAYLPHPCGRVLNSSFLGNCSCITTLLRHIPVTMLRSIAHFFVCVSRHDRPSMDVVATDILSSRDIPSIHRRHRSCASMRPRYTVHPVHKKTRRTLILRVIETLFTK
jgi:hypothetical protein